MLFAWHSSIYFLYYPPPSWPLPFRREKISRKGPKTDFSIQLNRKIDFSVSSQVTPPPPPGGWSWAKCPLPETRDSFWTNYTPRYQDWFHPGTFVQEALNCAGLTPESVDSFRSSGSSAQLLWALHGLLESLAWMRACVHACKHWYTTMHTPCPMEVYCSWRVVPARKLFIF